LEIRTLDDNENWKNIKRYRLSSKKKIEFHRYIVDE
jgi:hypothetical protein